jgi:PAS domain S-box-containing protein
LSRWSYGEGFVARLLRVPIAIPVRYRASIVVLALWFPAFAAGLWGYYSEEPAFQNPLEAVTYVWLPMLMFAAFAAGVGRRPAALLWAVAILDLDVALLGVGQLMVLPFVVAVPLVGVALAARRVPVDRLKIPYIAAWMGSSTAVAFAAIRSVDQTAPSVLAVIPLFMFIDALALALLWQLDNSRLRAVNAAAAAESRIQDLLNGVDLVAVNVGWDSRVDYVNDFALRLTGWTRDEVIGCDWWDTFATPDRREAARDRFKNIVTGRIVMEHERESTIVTKAGDVRLIRWSHVTRHDVHGNVAGIASLGEDITAARAAEEDSRRDAELLSKLVISSPLPTVVMDLDRVVQLWNPAATELLGWPEEEVVGKRIPAGVYANDRWAVGRAFARAHKGEPLDHELTDLSRRDGQKVRVRLYGGVLLDRDGVPMSVGLQAVDVTLALAMEDQLREAQKMEAIGRLAGGVAHDFNNSLTAIGGFASLIATGSKEPETREAAETILGASKRAADLTRELLAYSRKSMLAPQVIDVNTLLGSVRPMLPGLLGEDISVIIESRVPEAMVRADPGGLERVIVNLAANARDAMPDGGRLTISTDRRLYEATAESGGGARVVISVVDTGVGIPAALHSKVFDPFFTTKPVGSGTGLGLAMVKGFVVQSGGEVAIRSEPGHGTTIEIILPEVVEGRRAVASESAVLVASGYSADSFASRVELPSEFDLIEKPYEPEQLLRRVREAIDSRAGDIH